MTAVRYQEYTLLCDRDDCNAAYGPFGVERPRPLMRRLAKRDGWAYIPSPIGRSGGFDYCPTHKPETP